MFDPTNYTSQLHIVNISVSNRIRRHDTVAGTILMLSLLVNQIVVDWNPPEDAIRVDPKHPIYFLEQIPKIASLSMQR